MVLQGDSNHDRAIASLIGYQLNTMDVFKEGETAPSVIELEVYTPLEYGSQLKEESHQGIETYLYTIPMMLFHKA